MGMITREDLERLHAYEVKPDSPVLSLYLTVDRSQMRNARHQMETILKQLLRSIEGELEEREKEAFREDAGRVEAFLSEYEPQAPSLVIFCDASEDFFWARALSIPLRNLARWDTLVYLRPLLEALDEYERFGVVLTDKTRSRLFTVFLGEIREEREAFAPARVRHIKTTGTDHIWSQKRIQRQSETHALWHLKQVAGELDRLTNRYAFDRLILAGPVEATSELYRLLPKRLRSRVAGTLSLPVEATPQEVLAEALKVEQAVERSAEITLVEELLTAAAKQDRATQGVVPTLQALQEGRIWQLVYAHDLALRGAVCTHCTALLPQGEEACPYCGQQLEVVEDLVERMVARVLEQGGRVEEVHGIAAQNLQKAGGIGAFLRF
ncbi:MAG: hypothetical protein D6736_13350 [Nitrospinota bacterium]|nr:MAG: hypothetical protein D6736_13350 [Nitrospinota bacterium]